MRNAEQATRQPEPGLPAIEQLFKTPRRAGIECFKVLCRLSSLAVNIDYNGFNYNNAD